jgi:PAS domain S-box-containing protein
MTDNKKPHRTKEQWIAECEELRRQLEEAQQTLEAIRSGQVDALVVAGPEHEQVYSLAGAEHIYRVIVETMNEAALTVDPDGTILFCNQRFCDLMKSSIGEVMGRKLIWFAAPPQQRLLQRLLRDAQSGPVQRRLTLLDLDGRDVPVQLSASLLDAGESPSICLVATDLTELEGSVHSVRVLREHEQALQEANEQLRVQAEELMSQSDELRTQTEELQVTNAALRESEQRFRTLADNISQLAWMADETGWIFWYNKRWHEYTGTTLEDAEGRGWHKVTHPDHVQRVIEGFERCIEKGEVWEDTFLLRGSDGWYHWFLSRAVPIRDENGKVVRWFGTNTDVTELRKAEERLRDLTRTLEDRVAHRTAELRHRAEQLQKLALELSETEDRERRHLAEILHDDLQQELAAAKFQLGFLCNRGKCDPGQQAKLLQVDKMLLDAIEKSRSLSHELSPAALHHDDLGVVLGWLAGQVKAKHGLKVNVDVFGEVTVESAALRSFLYKAAQEMLFNVVKHARVNQARIRTRRLGQCIFLSVSDRGRGFDPQEVRQTGGFGLLNIGERVRWLGGRMKMHSIRGKGSTFHVVVPDGPIVSHPEAVTADEGVASARRSTGGDESASSGSRLRVLLADDHDIVRAGLVSLLMEEEDLVVVGEAANGREAINQAYELHPDVVVMDMAMPLINGDEATRQIKAHLPEIRVVGLSMCAEADMVQKMYQAGAESYVLKTAPPQELLAAIRGQAALATASS